MKAVSFELGGKNAALVFADADLDAAVAGVARSTFTNTGQVCLCTERVYVERPVFDDVRRAVWPSRPRDAAPRLARATRTTTTGPLISREHRDKVLVAIYELAVRGGREVVTGGGVPDLATDLDGGAWFEPTILDRARPGRAA